MEQSKTWLQSEIWQLMAEEMKDYKHYCAIRRINFTWNDCAENVFMKLDSLGLIEYTP